MDESLRIQRLQQIPSSVEFESLIESTNIPAVSILTLYSLFVSREIVTQNFILLSLIHFFLKVFTGCVKDWKAFSKWNPSNGGLDYFQVSVQTL